MLAPSNRDPQVSTVIIAPDLAIDKQVPPSTPALSMPQYKHQFRLAHVPSDHRHVAAMPLQDSSHSIAFDWTCAGHRCCWRYDDAGTRLQQHVRRDNNTASVRCMEVAWLCPLRAHRHNDALQPLSLTLPYDTRATMPASSLRRNGDGIVSPPHACTLSATH
jgi:hypothetical protein